MKKLSIILLGFLLGGCVDLSQFGTQQIKVAYFHGKPDAVTECLYSAALSQHLYLRADRRLTNGTPIYNLQNRHGENIASLDISAFSEDQTTVDFFYDKAVDISATLAALSEQCERMD